jgi:elongation factor P
LDIEIWILTFGIEIRYHSQTMGDVISVNDLRPGTTIELDGSLFQVVDFQHSKQARGGAIVRTKMKNLKSGAITDKTFKGAETVDKAYIERRPMQYLYENNGLYVFMDPGDYHQIEISDEMIGSSKNYLKEGEKVQIQFYEEGAIGVELPNSVNLKVIDTDPGVRGDTASGGSKPAKLETGYTVRVPLFIENGEALKIDTRSGEYLGRA